MVMTVGVLGRGRLGTLVAAALAEADDLECAWTAGRSGPPEAGSRVDVAIDVSHADAVAENLDWARRTRTALVVGTTGWPGGLVPGRTDGPGVLIAPNFSLSMALMRRFATVLGGYAALTPGPADLGVTETHHRHKRDAPSGSAVLLSTALAEAAGRQPGDIATASLRVGEVVGRHEMRYESTTESITVSHVAHRREVFAEGALAAARWIHGRAGVHTLDDWAADQLDTLFGPVGAHVDSRAAAEPALT